MKDLGLYHGGFLVGLELHLSCRTLDPELILVDAHDRPDQRVAECGRAQESEGKKSDLHIA